MVIPLGKRFHWVGKQQLKSEVSAAETCINTFYSNQIAQVRKNTYTLSIAY